MRQQEYTAVLSFIRQYFAQHSISPSYREIADGCYINISTVQRYLDVLEAQGYINRHPGIARSIRLAGNSG